MNLSVEIFFETHQANIIYNAVMPEVETPATDKSKTELSVVSNNLVKLHIMAEDFVSLRSTINTWLRLIQVAYEVSSLDEFYLEKH